MSIKSIVAGGPVAILTAGGAVMWAQHELHYLLRPSVIETLVGIVAVGGGMAWAAKAKRTKPAAAVAAERTAEDIVTSWAPPVAGLPRGASGDPIDAAYLRLVTEARSK